MAERYPGATRVRCGSRHRRGGLLAAGAGLQIPPSAEENARTVGMTQLWGTEVLAGCALQPWALDAGPGLLAAGAELQIPPSADDHPTDEDLSAGTRTKTRGLSG
jgi:hypothetical protein